MELADFRNLALLDFSIPENKSAMERAIAKVRSELGKEYPLIIGDEKLYVDDKIRSLNPSNCEEVVGISQNATLEMVEKAISTAEKAFADWGSRSAEERVSYLMKVCDMMKARRMELGAWMVIETGKSWVEADADVAETIDFCDYYCRLALKLAHPDPLIPYAGEENECMYIPLGVGVVIPPWNFPLAIMAGMTFASMISGNTVVLKPSSDAPCIAAQLMKIFEEVGVPAGVVNYLPGRGSIIGDPLVKHPRTRFISFTGSKEVGLRINRLAADTSPGQIWIKRVLAEMGGKDTIIVDEEADLESAVAGVVSSAFGFQGQKCSACSRVIVHESIYDEFLERTVARTREVIQEGSVEDYGVNFGPVINRGAQKSILNYIEIGKKEGRLLLGGDSGDPQGCFVKPTIIADIDPMAVISQEEIFGPVLAVIKSSDYDDALKIANNTEYGLTGAVYTANEEKIERARREFHVGNLYFNRKCTGALVGVHPFGGFNMSGTDSKAGGPDYLFLFTQMKSLSRAI
jgi:1-pyrroline-5-carboxylate dehydrogenase